MGDTATKAPKASKAKKIEQAADAAVPATGEATASTEQTQTTQVAEAAGEAKAPRTKKNATSTNLDVNDPNSSTAWLAEFYDQSQKQAARKGYDQHWNKEGFIHAGPADRLPNSGAAKMAIFIGDMLVKREVAGDAEAGQFLDFIINFCTNRRNTLQAERDTEILAAAEAIRSKQTPAA